MCHVDIDKSLWNRGASAASQAAADGAFQDPGSSVSPSKRGYQLKSSDII